MQARIMTDPGVGGLPVILIQISHNHSQSGTMGWQPGSQVDIPGVPVHGELCWSTVFAIPNVIVGVVT